jgi:hypothetical protein
MYMILPSYINVPSILKIGPCMVNLSRQVGFNMCTSLYLGSSTYMKIHFKPISVLYTFQVTFNPETLKCCVCYERDRLAFLTPCGHLYCMVCDTNLESTQMSCAECRTSITGVGRLHA